MARTEPAGGGDCEEIAGLASEFLEGELDAPAMARVGVHLLGCCPCAQLYAELALTIAAVHRLGPRMRLAPPCGGARR